MVYKYHIELSTCHFYLIDEGFALAKVKDNVDCDLEGAIEIDDLTYETVEGKPFVILIDARDIRSSLTHEAREYIATNKKIAGIRKAQAIVVNNLHIKILANFYMNFHRTSNPVKVFSDYSKAEKWLKEIRSKWYK